MEQTIYRASLIPLVLCVETHGLENEWHKAQFVRLHVTFYVDGTFLSRDVWGSSLCLAVRSAQVKFGNFDTLTLFSGGNSERIYFPPPDVANAQEDQLSYIAQLHGNKLVVNDLEDDDDRSESFTRLMSVEANGKIMIFQGSGLSDCVRSARRFLVFDELFFDELPKTQTTKKPTLHAHAPKPLPHNDLWNVFR